MHRRRKIDWRASPNSLSHLQLFLEYKTCSFS
jgi:hypothetical protein